MMLLHLSEFAVIRTIWCVHVCVRVCVCVCLEAALDFPFSRSWPSVLTWTEGGGRESE